MFLIKTRCSEGKLNNPKVWQSVFGFFPIHFYRRWINLYISSELSLELGVRIRARVRVELVKMHVAVYTFRLSNLQTIDTQLYSAKYSGQ